MGLTFNLRPAVVYPVSGNDPGQFSLNGFSSGSFASNWHGSTRSIDRWCSSDASVVSGSWRTGLNSIYDWDVVYWKSKAADHRYGSNRSQPARLSRRSGCHSPMGRRFTLWRNWRDRTPRYPPAVIRRLPSIRRTRVTSLPRLLFVRGRKISLSHTGPKIGLALPMLYRRRPRGLRPHAVTNYSENHLTRETRFAGWPGRRIRATPRNT